MLRLLAINLLISALSYAQTPQPGQSSSIDSGTNIYAQLCAGCHGPDARGTDRAPNLAVNRRLRARSTEQIRGIVEHGIPASGMPAFELPHDQLDAVAAFVHSLNSAAADNPVAGDPTRGERIFFADGRCVSCHMMSGTGATLGPDLSNSGREMTIDEMRDKLLHPDRRISPGYQLVTVQLRTGETIRGFARGRTNFDLALQDLNGRFHLLENQEIASVHDENHSLMQPVAADESQDLLAYLSRLTGVKTRPSGIDSTGGPHHALQPDFERIKNPQPGDWATYNGTLRGNRYSELKDINTANAGSLALKWIFPIPHFGVESTPLVFDGVMYVTGPNQAYALDAATGRLIWSYSRPRTQGLVGDASLGTNRGVALLGDKVFMVTDNAHLIALNRITGSLVWEVVMPEEPQHYGSTVAPLIIGDTVIAGVSGGDWGIRGFVACFQASTGERLWRHWTIPAKGEPGSETWGGDPRYGGGSTWLTGTYDSESDTLYWPTGNPYPDSDDHDRPGDNLFTDCILALNPRNGALKWYYQFTPHDVRDRDANEPPVLIDTQYQGQNRKLLLHANRNGFFYVLDRTNGHVLLAKRFLHRMNWATGIGPDARPQLSPAKPYTSRESGCPGDAANWSSTAFNPTTRLYYVMTLEECAPEEVRHGLKAPERPDEPGQKYLRAINIDTGDVAWEVPQVGAVFLKTWPGVLATAGGLVLFGDPSGAFVAADARDGQTLWHFPTNTSMKASPMTYLVNGKQFVAIAAGSNILAFSKP